MPRNGAGGSAHADRDVVQAVPQSTLTSVPLNPPKDPVAPRGYGVSVSIKKIAPNPRNLRGEELWETPEQRAAMVTSLASELGLIQALVVCEFKEFLKKYPDLKGHKYFTAETEYVLIAGHCRLDAAPDAGLEELRIDVQNELIDWMDEVFIQENMRRVTLNPFHEALGYERLAKERSLSNKALADRLGVSKSLIVKRRALLRIGRKDWELVNSGAIGLNDAYNLLAALGEWPTGLFRAAAELFISNPDLTVKDAATAVLNPAPEETAEAETPSSEPELESPPAPPVEQQPDPAPAELTAEKDSDEPRTEIVPAAATADKPAAPSKPAKPTSAAPAPTKDDRLRAEASTARDQACRALVTTHPGSATADPASARIVASNLANATTEALKLAHKWVHAAGAQQADILDADAYRNAVLFGTDTNAAQTLAYALALAEEEVRAADRRRKWGPRTRAHVQHLIDHAGYEPNDWEKRNL